MLHTLLYFLALFTLSTSPVWAKLNHMSVEVLGFYRLGISSLLLLFWVFAVKKTPLPRLQRSQIWVVLSGFLFFLHLWTFKYAAKNTTISNGMIIFSSNPIWSSIGAVFFFKEKLHKRLYFAYFMALLGIYLLVARELSLGQGINKGDLASLFSAIFFALYMLSGKKARQHFSNNIYALGQYIICTLFFWFCMLYTGADYTGYDATSWWAIVGLIAMPTFFGHFTMTYLVSHMNLSIMSCGKLIEPVTASIIAAIVFSEKLSPNAPWAFALTSMSVAILFYPSLKPYLLKLKP
ncbi:MAG: DMT family transporter [Pseudobdellovibrio sp.]